MIFPKNAALLVLALALSQAAAWAQTGLAFAGIVSLGDSLSDTGNNPPPPGSDYYQGEWSNGPLWDQYLAEGFNVPLHNVAFAGSQTSDLANQVTAAAGLSLDLSTNLCTLWSGANDFIQNTNLGLNDSAWNGVIHDGVANISNAVAALYARGARQFMIVNVPDLAMTPAGLQFPALVQDYFEIKITEFNSQLAATLTSFAQANQEVHLVPVDSYGLLNQVVAHPSMYGFTNVTQAALDVYPSFDGPATNFLFWDEIHPTTRGHALIGQAASNAWVEVPPSIVIQPTSQTLPVGTNALFVVSAMNAVSYQWRFNRDNIRNATNDHYLIPDIRPINAGTYSVEVKNPYGTVLSSNATLELFTPVSIASQPQSRRVVDGSSATLLVRARGTPPLHYQWQFYATNLPGATAPTLAFRRIALPDAGPYQAIITDPYGAITSAVAQLTVIVRPQILTQPQSAAVAIGQSVTFSVTAGGTPPLDYQWRWNGRNLSKATNSSLVLTNLQLPRAGDYSVKVSNPAGAALSSNAVLKVTAAPVP